MRSQELGGWGVRWFIHLGAEITKVDGRSDARDYHSQPSVGGEVTRKVVVGCNEGQT